MKNFTPILLMLVSIGLFFFFIDPKYKEVKALQIEIAANDETLVLAEELTKQRRELKDKFNLISADEKTELEKLLPDTVDNVRLIIDINNIAEKYGIVIQDINISSDQEPTTKKQSTSSEFEDVIGDSSLGYADTSKIGVISFSFSVSAQYDVFIDFLKDLEEALRIVDVRDITVNKNSETDVYYNYQINLDTYWLK